MRLALLSVAVLLIVALIGAVLARQVTRPVRRLEDAARDLADGRLDSRVPATGGPPELKSLAEDVAQGRGLSASLGFPILCIPPTPPFRFVVVPKDMLGELPPLRTKNV